MTPLELLLTSVLARPAAAAAPQDVLTWSCPVDQERVFEDVWVAMHDEPPARPVGSPATPARPLGVDHLMLAFRGEHTMSYHTPERQPEAVVAYRHKRKADREAWTERYSHRGAVITLRSCGDGADVLYSFELTMGDGRVLTREVGRAWVDWQEGETRNFKGTWVVLRDHTDLTRFHRDGSPALTVRYRDGVLDEYHSWFEGSEQVGFEGGFNSHGVPDGPWTFYEEDGSVHARGSFAAGLLTGPWEVQTDQGPLELSFAPHEETRLSTSVRRALAPPEPAYELPAEGLGLDEAAPVVQVTPPVPTPPSPVDTTSTAPTSTPPPPTGCGDQRTELGYADAMAMLADGPVAADARGCSYVLRAFLWDEFEAFQGRCYLTSIDNVEGSWPKRVRWPLEHCQLRDVYEMLVAVEVRGCGSAASCGTTVDLWVKVDADGDVVVEGFGTRSGVLR